MEISDRRYFEKPELADRQSVSLFRKWICLMKRWLQCLTGWKREFRLSYALSENCITEKYEESSLKSNFNELFYIFFRFKPAQEVHNLRRVLFYLLTYLIGWISRKFSPFSKFFLSFFSPNRPVQVVYFLSRFESKKYMKKLVEIEFQRAFLLLSAMQFDMAGRNAANIEGFFPLIRLACVQPPKDRTINIRKSIFRGFSQRGFYGGV